MAQLHLNRQSGHDEGGGGSDEDEYDEEEALAFFQYYRRPSGDTGNLPSGGTGTANESSSLNVRGSRSRSGSSTCRITLSQTPPPPSQTAGLLKIQPTKLHLQRDDDFGGEKEETVQNEPLDVAAPTASLPTERQTTRQQVVQPSNELTSGTPILPLRTTVGKLGTGGLDQPPQRLSSERTTSDRSHVAGGISSAGGGRKEGGDRLRLEIFSVRMPNQNAATAFGSPDSSTGGTSSGGSSTGTTTAPETFSFDPAKQYYVKCFLCEFHGHDQLIPVNLLGQDVTTSSSSSSAAAEEEQILVDTVGRTHSVSVPQWRFDFSHETPPNNGGNGSGVADELSPPGSVSPQQHATTTPQRIVLPEPILSFRSSPSTNRSREGVQSVAQTTGSESSAKRNHLLFGEDTHQGSEDLASLMDAAGSAFVIQLRTIFSKYNLDHQFVALQLKEQTHAGLILGSSSHVVATTVLPLKAFESFDSTAVREEWFPMYDLKAIRKKKSQHALRPLALIHCAISVPGGVPQASLGYGFHVENARQLLSSSTPGTESSPRRRWKVNLEIAVVSATLRPSEESGGSERKQYFKKGPPATYVTIVLKGSTSGVNTGVDSALLLSAALDNNAGGSSSPLLGMSSTAFTLGKYKTALHPPSFLPKYSTGGGGLVTITEEQTILNTKYLVFKVKAVSGLGQVDAVENSSTANTGGDLIGLACVPLQYFVSSTLDRQEGLFELREEGERANKVLAAFDRDFPLLQHGSEMLSSSMGSSGVEGSPTGSHQHIVRGHLRVRVRLIVAP